METIVHAKVEDFAKWKSNFDMGESLRAQFGCASAQIFQSDENSDEIFIVLNHKDEESAKAYAQSTELQEAMMKAGVVGQPDRWFVNKIS